nr:BAG family molecular chaperone regulator 1-like [Ipomoea batatas]
MRLCELRGQSDATEAEKWRLMMVFPVNPGLDFGLEREAASLETWSFRDNCELRTRPNQPREELSRDEKEWRRWRKAAKCVSESAWRLIGLWPDATELRSGAHDGFPVNPGLDFGLERAGEPGDLVSVIQMLLVCGVKDKSKVVLVEDPISQGKSYLETRKNAKMEKAAKCVSEISLEVDRLGGRELNVGALNNGVEPVEGVEALKVNEGSPPACRNDSMTEVVVDEAANNVMRDEGEIKNLRSERWAVFGCGSATRSKEWEG